MSSLIPNITSDAPSHEVGDLMYSGLISLGKDLEVEPELAKSWTFSKDCLTLDFQLREGVTLARRQALHGGRRRVHVGSHDESQDAQPLQVGLPGRRAVEKTGPHAVRVIYKQPYAKALVSWGVTILPKHLLESYVAAGKIKEAPQNWTAPVGTGPYASRR